MSLNVLRIAAFSQGNQGGNPAGVLISEKLPSAEDMQKIAHDVGFSETAFAMPEADSWRVRYFAPEMEVPFCGHATIALGAALAMREGDGAFTLKLNNATIKVEGRKEGDLFSASLQSPSTRNRAASQIEIECQSAFKRNPLSASKKYPSFRLQRLACAGPELSI